MDSYANLRDQFHQWQQNLSVRFRELFDPGDSCRCLPSTIWYVFFTAVVVLFWRSILTNRAATAAFN